jgi:tellurite resistance protein TerC
MFLAEAIASVATITLAAAESAPLMPPMAWIGFVVFVLMAMVVDLGLYQKRNTGLTTKAALTWVFIWACLAMIFNAGVWWKLGLPKAQEFFGGYLLEMSLSVDNLFVFVLVFSHFKTPRAEQHRVLVWGIIGAMVLRAIMIVAGVAIVRRFEMVMLLFAAILLWSGIKLLRNEEDEDDDPSTGLIVRMARRVLPVVDGYRGHAFFVVEDGKRKATLLFLVLIVIEFSDVLFAVDSIPAIFGITQDPFIVFTSNVFAILGLRSLFFVIEAAIQRLKYLKTGLAFILCFIGVKMILPFLHEALHHYGHDIDLPLLDEKWKMPIWLSLSVIVFTLGFSAGLSLWTTRRGAHDLSRSASGRMPVAGEPEVHGSSSRTAVLPDQPPPPEATPPAPPTPPPTEQPPS